MVGIESVELFLEKFDSYLLKLRRVITGYFVGYIIREILLEIRARVKTLAISSIITLYRIIFLLYYVLLSSIYLYTLSFFSDIAIIIVYRRVIL